MNHLNIFRNAVLMPISFIGFHRYVFLVYKQPGVIVDPEEGHVTSRSRKKRRYFRIGKFATKHNLGNPIAGNFFMVISKSC